MFNTTRTPVRVFRWDDEGAPKVNGTKSAIKTVLKACLVTGYGEGGNRKEPLGFDISFESETGAVFKSKDQKSNGWGVSVVANTDKDCYIRLILGAKSVNSGQEVVSNGNYDRFCFADSNGRTGNAMKWVVVGWARGFVLAVVNSDYASVNGVFCFGEFPSLAAGDSGNTFIAYSAGNYSYLGSGNDYLGCKIAKDYKGDGALFYSIKGGGIGSSSSSSSSSYLAAYPNPITGGFTIENLYLVEATKDSDSYPEWAVRGKFPGMMCTLERMPEFSSLTPGRIFNDLDNNSDEWMYIRNVNGLGLLINLTAWDV